MGEEIISFLLVLLEVSFTEPLDINKPNVLTTWSLNTLPIKRINFLLKFNLKLNLRQLKKDGTIEICEAQPKFGNNSSTSTRQQTSNERPPTVFVSKRLKNNQNSINKNPKIITNQQQKQQFSLNSANSNNLREKKSKIKRKKSQETVV